MNCMIMPPGKNLEIVIDTVVYDISTAMEKFPDITNGLVVAGVIDSSGVLVGDHYFTGDPTYEFRLKLSSDYPEQYIIDDVVNSATPFGVKLDKRSFNWCFLKAYRESDALDFIAWSVTNRPLWEFKLEDKRTNVVANTTRSETTTSPVESTTPVLSVPTLFPDIENKPETVPVVEEPGVKEKLEVTEEESVVEEKPAVEEGPAKESVPEVEVKSIDEKVQERILPTPDTAVLDEQEIQKTVITPDDGMPVFKSNLKKVLETAPIQQTVFHETSNSETEVPEECKGETWAQTWKHCKLADIESDVFCIEHNWEKRGEYYIIDCVMTGNRLIHSDKKGVNFAISAKLCR